MDQFCGTDYFSSQLKLARSSGLIWNTQTSPMALFLITGVPICGEKSSVDWNSGKCSAILRKMILALHGNISNEVFGGSTVS